MSEPRPFLTRLMAGAAALRRGYEGLPPEEARQAAAVAVAVTLWLLVIAYLLAPITRPGSISGLPFGFAVIAQGVPVALLILAFWLAPKSRDGR